MRYLLTVCLLSGLSLAQTAAVETLGLFTNSGDVGGPVLNGSASFDPAKGQYRITGAGTNVWDKKDEFQFVWREMTGNFAVIATVKFLGQGNAHRKAGIMVRQSLASDATYADVVIHGNGMPGLQWRSRQNEDTNNFDIPFDGPATYNIKLVRTGIRIFMFIGKEGSPAKEIAHTEVAFQGPVLVGLAVCSHQADKSDTVIFSEVAVEALPTPPVAQKKN